MYICDLPETRKLWEFWYFFADDTNVTIIVTSDANKLKPDGKK